MTMTKMTLKSKIKQAQNLVDIQCSNGNWNYDNYMHGMANGMMLILSIFTGVSPKFLTTPKKWLCDKKVKGKTAFEMDFTIDAGKNPKILNVKRKKSR